MLIKDIPYKKVRELAEKYAKEIPWHEWDEWDTEVLENSFIWETTEEGQKFWEAVDDARWEAAKFLQPELFLD